MTAGAYRERMTCADASGDTTARVLLTRGTEIA
jgi:hypothetical protein